MISNTLDEMGCCQAAYTQRSLSVRDLINFNEALSSKWLRNSLMKRVRMVEPEGFRRF